MKNILVPTDFSENALKAALYAAEIAKRTGATIFFLHSAPVGTEKLDEPLPLYDKYKNIVLDDIHGELEKFRKVITAVYKDVKTEIILKDGPIAQSIAATADEKKADLILMGTKGASGIKGALVGTVASDTIKLSSAPVLIVPEDYVIEQPDAILFATHHFEKNQSLLAVILEMARIFSASIHVVVFVDIDNAYSGQVMESNEQLEGYLDFLKSTYPDIQFRGEVIDGRDFETAIERYHLHHQTDMAAMITYPKGFWEKIFHKSVTRKMAFHSTTPVLAIHYHE